MSENPGLSGQAFPNREVSFHDHFEALLNAQQEFVKQGFDLRDRASVSEREALTEKLARLNELREIVTSVMASSATKDELSLARSNVETLTRAIAAEIRGEMVSSKEFRIAHDEVERKSDAVEKANILWLRFEERVKPLEKIAIVAEAKADVWKANLGIGMAGIALAVSFIRLVMDYFAPITK